MKLLSTLALVVAVLLPSPGWTAISCPDRTPTAIAAPAAASAKCQATISKAGLKFAKAKLKAMAKCMAAQVPGACPSVKETDKINKAAMKGAEGIANDCATDSVQAGLASTTYAGLTDDSVIGSCMLSQHNVTADILLGEINGTPGRVKSNTLRDKCVKTLNKTGVKQATGAHKIVNKCLTAQGKLGTTGDLSAVCVGHWAGGAFVAPTDTNAAEALSALQAKTEAAIAKDCTITTGLIESIFACPGAASVADLQACIVCDTWDAILDFVADENSESGTYVANGPGAIQTAVNAAAAGTKLLIASGDYPETITIGTNGLQLVGCGGATDTRPSIQRPTDSNNYPNGISAGSVDGLVFQSLDLFNWDENGIFIGNANGVTFRDVHADGNLSSTYGIFPVQCNNVVVEDSSATNVRDAGIYIGQSTNIVSRYNTATGNVAGMEIENCDTAVVHNNYTADNSGGLLVFKLPFYAIQFSNNHQVFDNVSVHNNTPNFGIPGSTVSLVPTGTGLLIISNDDSEFHHNLVTDNDSFGIALVDQDAVNFLVGPPPPFDPESPDQKCENNKIHDNFVAANGSNPDSPVGGDLIMALGDDSLPHGNCIQDNNLAPFFLSGANDCP